MKKTTKELRAELRKTLKENDLKAIRMVLYMDNEDGSQSIEDIAESDSIIQQGFKYNGFLEDRCIRWANRDVDITGVPIN